MNFEAILGPRRIVLSGWASNPHASNFSIEHPLTEFLERRDLQEEANRQYGANLRELIPRARAYVERVAAIDAALAALPVDERLATYANDPKVQSRTVTAVGRVYTHNRRELVVADESGTLVDRCGPPFDGELLSIRELYCLADVVFVSQEWLHDQGDRGFVRYEVGRGWSSRCIFTR
jgi:hypothetical protein